MCIKQQYSLPANHCFEYYIFLMAPTACACLLNFWYIDEYGNRIVIVLQSK